ncbi:MAG: MBL fold metallo-hydrolase [Solirubrobacterales bacterium]|nr:MBL fold metallo-hydrolase [Solirubrobacterales bacterium]HMT05431.1 MBL fold metallo-hydrolase [Solirubrobacterales bacterium]
MTEEMADGGAPGFPGIWRVMAKNPGPMTLTGTNTYLYGSEPCWVIDPGPEDERHIDAVREAIDERGGAAGVLLTHSHADHTGGVKLLGIDPVPVEDGDVNGGLEAVSTPGHTTDHFCYFTADGACFSGDLILGWGSTYVPPDGGSLAAYMRSLMLIRSRDPELICPGHGPWITDPSNKVLEYIEHRDARERGLLSALERGERSRMNLLAEVWSDVPEQLLPAANLVMEAHLEKLEAEGRLPNDLAE